MWIVGICMKLFHIRQVPFNRTIGIQIVHIFCLVLIFDDNAASIAEGSGRYLGNVSSSYSGVVSNFDEYWNQLTPENAGKWGNVEGSRDQMNWGMIENSYNFTKENGFPFKQHTFVWGRQEPNWIGGLSESEQREEVEEWIKAYGDRFPETDYIDVVNEPINTPASYREALGGEGETGVDWIIWAFKKAREHCPHAKLLINDFNIINHESNVMGYLGIISLLQARDLIDGIGIQSHYWSVQGVETELLKSNLDKLAAAGLPIHVSELDITGNDEEQLVAYQRIFPIFWEHPAVAGVTLWGWRYGRTWVENTHLVHENGRERPALQWLREYVEAYTGGTRRQMSFASLPDNSFSITPAGTGCFHLRCKRQQDLLIRCFNCAGQSVTDFGNRRFQPGSYTILLPVHRFSSGNYFIIAQGIGTRVRELFTIVR